MSDIENKAIELMDKLENLATSYAPDVIDSAMSAVKVSAIQELIWGVVFIFLSVAVSIAAYKIFFHCEKKKKERPYSEWDVGLVLAPVLGSCVVIPFALYAVNCFLDIWNWVALVNPKLALAHKVLGL